MKTKKCRPVLVESKENTGITLGINITKNIPGAMRGQNYELILISLEDEEYNEGDYVLCKNQILEVDSNKAYSGANFITLSYCRQNKFPKVIATQSQISPEYIAKFIEQYNNGKVDDVEIEMQEWNKAKMPKDFLKYIEPGCGLPIIAGSEEVYYKPKLTNKFVTIVTIVEKKEPILYTEEEVKDLFIRYRCFRNENPELSIWDHDQWFQENEKK